METISTQMGSATQIAADVRAGRRTSREIVDGCLARIAAKDAQINAFQTVLASSARAEADALALREDLASLPLAGVPVAVKDNIDVAGVATRHGSAATLAKPAATDDELVRRLRAAGAIIVGTTRMPELAIWGFTDSAAFGETLNPRDLSRNSGGSTGGGAAAVAAGMAAVALGSDGGGSLRIPAANCGVVGFKPARGIVPLAGGAADHWFGCTAYGPITTVADDIPPVMSVLSGEPVPPKPVGALRIAVSLKAPSPLGPPDSAARDAVTKAVASVRAAGHTVTKANPPYPATLVNRWVEHWLAGVAVDAERLGLDLNKCEPRTQAVIKRGQRVRRRGRPDGTAALAWCTKALDWFDSYDVLITPVVSRPAPQVGWARHAGYWRAYLASARGIPFTPAWNFAGFPAMAVGSVQLICRPGAEAALYSLAASL